MAVNMKPASADTVRAWAAETGWEDEFGRPPKERGRLHTQLIADFDKAHKRNRVQYMPGYKDDNAGTASNASRSTEVATRTPAKKATPAKATRSSRTADEDEGPVRVRAERVKNTGGEVATAMPTGTEPASVADVIAMLQSAAQATGGKTKGMLAYYTLVG